MQYVFAINKTNNLINLSFSNIIRIGHSMYVKKMQNMSQISQSAPSLVASAHQKHSHSEWSVQSSPLHTAEPTSNDTISAMQLGYGNNWKRHHIKHHEPNP